MAENKRWRSKLGGKYPYKRPIGGRLSDKHAAAAGQKRSGAASNNDSEKTPLKKKSTMNFKRSATGLTAGDIEFVKSRKSSLLMGNSSSEGGYSKRNAMLKGNGTVE